MRITDGLESGVVAQMRNDIGRQYLVHDHHADKQPQQHASAHDAAHWHLCGLEVHVVLDGLREGAHLH